MEKAGFLKNYSLSVILFILFITTWIAQTMAGWMEFQSEQQAHQETAKLLGESGYIWPWLKSTMENWQSEFLQLFSFVVLTAYFIHKGSHESKDTDDEMMALLKKVDAKLTRLEKG
jgi:hypothetical protein